MPTPIQGLQYLIQRHYQVHDPENHISSGAEVANDTMVIPIMILGMFSRNEKATADFNNQFPPSINRIKPTAINKKFNIRKILANIAE